MSSYTFVPASSHRIADASARAMTTAHTHVAVVKVASVPGSGVTRGIHGWHSGTAARRAHLVLNGNTSGTLAYIVGATTVDPSTTIVPPVAGEWLLVGATKATGTVAVNFFMYNYTTGAWTEYASSGTVGNRTASGANPEVGALGAASYFDGTIAACMSLGRVLTLGEWRDLAHGRRAWWAAYDRASDSTAWSSTLGNSPWLDFTTPRNTAPDWGFRYYTYSTGAAPTLVGDTPPGW